MDGTVVANTGPMISKMPLQEDIIAELEDLLLYSRLKIVQDAKITTENVLWRHLQHFPVFAEIVLFLVEQDEKPQLAKLFAELDRRVIRYSRRDEQVFVWLLQSSELGRTRKYPPARQRSADPTAAQEWSAAYTQLLQIHMTLDCRMPSLSISFFHQANQEFERCLECGLLREATRTMLLMYTAFNEYEFSTSWDNGKGPPAVHIGRMYQRLMQECAEEELCSLIEHPETSNEDVHCRVGALLYCVVAKVCLIRSTRVTSEPNAYSDDIAKQKGVAASMLLVVLSFLPDTTPRGKYAEFLGLTITTGTDPKDLAGIGQAG